MVGAVFSFQTGELAWLREGSDLDNVVMVVHGDDGIWSTITPSRIGGHGVTTPLGKVVVASHTLQTYELVPDWVLEAAQELFVPLLPSTIRCRRTRTAYEIGLGRFVGDARKRVEARALRDAELRMTLGHGSSARLVMGANAF